MSKPYLRPGPPCDRPKRLAPRDAGNRKCPGSVLFFFAVFFTGLALEFDTPPTKDCLGPYSAGFWPCWKVSPERSCPPGLCRQPSSGLRPDLANYPQLRLLTTNARAVHLLRASFYLGEPPGIGGAFILYGGQGGPGPPSHPRGGPNLVPKKANPSHSRLGPDNPTTKKKAKITLIFTD